MSYYSPREIERKKALAQQLRAQPYQRRGSTLSGLAHVLRNWGAGRAERALTEQEESNKDLKQEEMNRLITELRGGAVTPYQQGNFQHPEVQALYANSLLANQLAQTKANTSTPSNVAEWNFYSQLPADQQEQYLTMKRANPWQNMGGEMVRYSPTTNQPMATHEKTLAPQDEPVNAAAKAAAIDEAKAEVALEKNEAERQQEASFDLPKLEEETNNSIALLDKLIDHPGLSATVGVPGVTKFLPATEAADFQTLLDQIKGKQFMSAYQTLKGGGQITEIEGRKATEAIARMNTSQSEEAFKEGVRDFRAVLEAGLKRAKGEAGVEESSSGLSSEEEEELKALEAELGL